MKRMHGLLTAFLLIGMIGCGGGKNLVHWVSLEKGLSMQQDSGRPILFYFYSKDCMYCKLMNMNTFSDPVVAEKINSGWIPVKLDIEEKQKGDMPSGSKLASAFGIRAVPALVAVNRAHRTLGSRVGFLTVRKTFAFLSEISAPREGKGE